MNPFAWRQEHQVAIILGAVLGEVILLVIGFMYRGLNYGTISSALFWSASTHDAMPPFNLSSGEIEAMIAYIDSFVTR
jgi:hypothetical protein